MSSSIPVTLAIFGSPPTPRKGYILLYGTKKIDQDLMSFTNSEYKGLRRVGGRGSRGEKRTDLEICAFPPEAG